MNDNVKHEDSEQEEENIEQIGDILKNKRLELRLTNEEIYNALKIRSNIVEELESSSWDHLEKHTHLANFAKQYAKFLKINDESLMEKITNNTKQRHNAMQEHSPINTLKDNAKALNNLSDTKSNFSMKRKNSGSSTAMLFIAVVVFLIVLIGCVFAYKQGLFSSTTDLLQNKNTSKVKSKDDDSSAGKSLDKGEKEQIKIVKLTQDSKNNTVLEEDVDSTEENNAVKQSADDRELQDAKTLDDAKKYQEEVAQNTQAPILTLTAINDVWIYVKDTTKNVVVAKILKADEEFKIPTGENMYMSISSSYNVKGSLDDKSFAHLGRKKQIINMLQVTKHNLNRYIP